MQFPNYTPNPYKNSLFYYDDYWCLRNKPPPIQEQVQPQVQTYVRPVYYYSVFQQPNFYHPRPYRHPNYRPPVLQISPGYSPVYSPPISYEPIIHSPRSDLSGSAPPYSPRSGSPDPLYSPRSDDSFFTKGEDYELEKN